MSPRETKAERALRIISERRLTVEVVGDAARPGLIVARCRGETEATVYRLGYRPDERRWGCECAANRVYRRTCCHLLALQRVCVRPSPPGVRFTDWLRGYLADPDGPIGDLAHDVERDPDWPHPASLDEALAYLRATDASDAAMHAMEQAWEQWRNDPHNPENRDTDPGSRPVPQPPSPASISAAANSTPRTRPNGARS